MPSQGTTVRLPWTIHDVARNPLTGMVYPGDISFRLHRTTSTGIVASSETITMTEVGVTGTYAISFVPANSGFYLLELKELNPNTNGEEYRFPVDVFAAGSAFVPAFTDSFCSLADVTRWLQQPIDTSTSPDDGETAAFAASRAGVLMSLCAGLGYAVTPSTVTVGSRLQTLLRDANAIGAALDYTAAQILSVQPSKSDRFDYFRQLWTDYVGGPQPGFVPEVTGRIEREITANLVSLGTDHILSGDTAPAAATYPTDIGIQVTMGDKY